MRIRKKTSSLCTFYIWQQRWLRRLTVGTMCPRRTLLPGQGHSLIIPCRRRNVWKELSYNRAGASQIGIRTMSFWHRVEIKTIPASGAATMRFCLASLDRTTGGSASLAVTCRHTDLGERSCRASYRACCFNSVTTSWSPLRTLKLRAVFPPESTIPVSAL